MTRLTKQRLEAIEESLMARLAGEMDVEDIDREHYEAALDWTSDQIALRKRRVKPETTQEVKP